MMSPKCHIVHCIVLAWIVQSNLTVANKLLLYLTLPYLTLPHLTLPYLTLPYLTLPYLTLPYLTLPYLTLPYLTLPYLTGSEPWDRKGTWFWPVCKTVWETQAREHTSPTYILSSLSWTNKIYSTESQVSLVLQLNFIPKTLYPCYVPCLIVPCLVIWDVRCRDSARHAFQSLLQGMSLKIFQ